MDRYETLGVLGEGSYGTVLKCRHRDTGRLVAVKKFLDSDDDKTVRKIALREIKLLKQLRHDNLVSLLEVCKRRRRWYLVFELLEQTVLDQLERNPNGLGPKTTREHLYQILTAIAFCHHNNVIHRDIKPENILVSQGGVVKICDFGFARTVASPGDVVVYTDYVATRWYRAPELLVGDTKYGKPVDVWAVGCLFIEMLTGEPLFPGDSDLDQLYHIVRCFGNLTSRHQEMFHRNPLFSGVRLPEATCTLPLEHRAPTLTHTALDLAQNCLQMDPERRTQCSDLLQHQLFTHDCFHTRFLEELNAKIQQDQKETSSLPTITTTPNQRRDTEEGAEKSGRGGSGEMEEKNGKTKEGADERVVKKKDKQSSKPSKTSRSLSEPTAKRSKAPDAKATESTASRGKAGKSNTPEIRDVSRTTKTPSTPRHTDSTVTNRTSPEKSTTIYKVKLGRATNLEMKREHLKNTLEKTETDVNLSKTSDVVHSTDSKSMTVKLKPLVPSHSEARREPSEGKVFTETNSTTKALKTLSSIQTDRTSTTETPLKVSTEPLPTCSPETKSLKLDVKEHLNPSLASDCLRNLTNQHLDIGLISKTSRTPTNDNMISNSNANGGKASTTTCYELTKTTDILSNDKTMSVISRTFTNSSHNDPACTETTKVTADAVPITSVLDSNLTGNTFMNISKVHRDQSNLSGVTADQTNPESPTRFSNSNPCKATSKPNAELTHDESTPEPIKDATSPTEHANSRASVMDSTVPPVDDTHGFETRDVKPRDVSSDDAGMDSGLPPGLWSINEQRHDSKMDPGSDVTVTTTVKMKHLTVEDKNDKADLKNFDVIAENHDKVGRQEGETKDDIDRTLPPPSPPIPPPPPSSTPFLFPSSAPLLPPPTSTPLMPHRSLTIHSNNLSLGVGLQPGTHSLRCMDKPRRHPAMYNRLTNHPTGTLTAQVLSEKMVIRERSFLCERGNHSNHGSVAMVKRRADVRFPDLRSSLPLPELRAGDGKHIQRSSTKEQRKDKRHIPSIPPP